MDLQDLKASQELEEQLDNKLDQLDQGVEGWPTQGGETAPVQLLWETWNELVYSGKAGGTERTHKGGAANYLCMPLDQSTL